MSLQLSYMEIDSLCRVESFHENLLAFASPQRDETRLQATGAVLHKLISRPPCRPTYIGRSTCSHALSTADSD